MAEEFKNVELDDSVLDAVSGGGDQSFLNEFGECQCGETSSTTQSKLYKPDNGDWYFICSKGNKHYFGGSVTFD